jgi:REP element-mobilizing transposase RayT
MDKFKNKYRIPSARLQWWDYGANGAYFITICTKDRQHYFGEIVDIPTTNNQTEQIMQLNELGQLAEKYWMEIPIHFPFIELGNFVVMPNHTHGILIIDKPVQTLQCNVSTINKNEQMAKISPKSGSISTIIRSYKSVVSKNARLINEDFAWQSRFHDHIIRDAQSFERIQNYIANNPGNWVKDKFHINND